LQQRPLVAGELVADRTRQPTLALAAIGLERGPALIRQLYERPAAIVGVRSSLHERSRFELADRLSHRLRADPLREREVTDAPWALAVQPSEDGSLRQVNCTGCLYNITG
jgi:hypothetical protein